MTKLFLQFWQVEDTESSECVEDTESSECVVDTEFFECVFVSEFTLLVYQKIEIVRNFTRI